MLLSGLRGIGFRFWREWRGRLGVFRWTVLVRLHLNLILDSIIVLHSFTVRLGPFTHIPWIPSPL